MISRVMEGKEEVRGGGGGGGGAGLDNSSFSAVLQEIYQQTQKEIDARNRNLNLNLGSQYPAIRGGPTAALDEIRRPTPFDLPPSLDEIRRPTPFDMPPPSSSSPPMNDVRRPSLSASPDGIRRPTSLDGIRRPTSFDGAHRVSPSLSSSPFDDELRIRRCAFDGGEMMRHVQPPLASSPSPSSPSPSSPSPSSASASASASTSASLYMASSSSSYDVTGRFEPLMDPALSFISGILAEDDEPAINHPFLDLGEFVAYQAKASEMAALLKEDSPGLALKIEAADSPVSPDDGGGGGGSFSSLSDDSSGFNNNNNNNNNNDDDDNNNNNNNNNANYTMSCGSIATTAHSCLPLGYLDMEMTSPPPLFPASAISEPSRNELLLTSLRGPIHRPLPPSTVTSPPSTINNSNSNSNNNNNSSCIAQPESFVNGHGLARQAQRGSGGRGRGRAGRALEMGSARSQDDIEVATTTTTTTARSHGLRIQKPEKAGRTLKPRKESSKRGGSGGSGAKSRAANKDMGSGEQECVELNDLLLQCAYAVGANNTKRAVEILKKVRQYATPYGNGAERLAYYFAEAMEARFSGTGWPLYLGLLERRPSAAEILKSIYMYMEHCPFVKAYHYFINHTILKVAKGATKLHILELQIDGFQYPALFKALADRPGGPPEVHIIGLGFPHYSMLPARTDVVMEAVQKIGKLLEAYAAKCRVPFQYTPWAGVREDLCMQDFVSPYRRDGEVLVVISASLLRYVMDDTLDSPIVRSKLLKQGRDINLEVYIQGIVTGSYSTPFFTRRFKEALFHFESVFDMLDTFIERERTERLVFESEILGKAILNIVACEGAEVVDRVDKYKHWQLVTEEVGFQQLPLDAEIKGNTQHMLETWHKEYTVSQDSQYLLMGWKGRMLHAMSTWKAPPEDPPPTTSSSSFPG